MVLARELLPNYRCSTCNESQKRTRGCDGPPELPVTFDGRPADRCPMRPFLDDPERFNTLFLIYRWYKEGYLVDPGGIMDQANRLLAFLAVIDATLDDAQAEKRRRAEREQHAAQAKARGKAKTHNRRPTGYRGKRGRR